MVSILLVHVVLAFPPRVLNGDTQRVAVAEAAAIWAAHGIVVSTPHGAATAGGDTLTVGVVVKRRPPTFGTDWHGPLASITFDETGTPIPEITLYLPDLVDLIARSNIAGSGGDPWPSILRERAVGRAVGRVLAHELGHYLLRSRTHARSGLMRAVQSAADLVAAGRETFALEAADVERLTALSSHHEGLAPIELLECVMAEWK